MCGFATKIGCPFLIGRFDYITTKTMKKFTLGFLAGLMFALPVLALSAPNLAEKLKGKILLAVEDKGKTYYVANDGYRYRITTATAQKVFEKLALGISNSNLAEIEEKDLGISPDSQSVCQDKTVEKIVYVNNYTGSNDTTDNSSADNAQTSQPQETYNHDSYYPIILSLKDNKGNIKKSSSYNQYSSIIDYISATTNTTLKVGDELILTIEAKDPQGRPLFYNWNSNSQRFNELVGIENGDHKYTTNNELRYTISSDDLQTGETLRIVSQIRSEKNNYRFGQGACDDVIFIDYKLSQ
jgi:hypothetical protein